MKIAVFFGSFNPLTKAHFTAMQEAVSHLNADKGLFVATNGQYLRRKTVKINDPFYLTEEERKETIEKTCRSHENLSFWGYEMGGMTPSRYKTLCKIQKQYPDATLYEVMGADKVHTLAKSSHGEDYLTRFRFAVFQRNDIDLDKLFAEQEILAKHRASFVMLPALPRQAGVSSTEVRRRFNAGEDYTDLVPPASATVLQRHAPTEFSISFEERIRTILRSGRYGSHQACSEIYGLNAQLFTQWRNGTCAIDMGDHQAFLDNTKLYTREYRVDGQGKTYPTTETGCMDCDCVDLAEALIAKGYDPAILNLASARSPGGGYHQGYAAQEESLCHSSNLSQSLYQFGSTRFKHIRECGVPNKTPGYPLDTNFGGVYTPNVTFFRHSRSKLFSMRKHVFPCDVITVAALSFNGRSDFSGVNEITYRAADGGFTPDGEAIMLNKIRTIFRMGVEHGKDALILGAFGCGAYKLPAEPVAKLFRRVMNEPEFAGKFRLLVFAIMEPGRKPKGLEGKFAPFYREFGTYAL